MEIKYSKTQLVKSALHYAADNLTSLIDAYTTTDGSVEDSETVNRFKSLRRQMIEYRDKRFGKPPDPTDDCVLVDVRTTRF